MSIRTHPQKTTARVYGAVHRRCANSGRRSSTPARQLRPLRTAHHARQPMGPWPQSRRRQNQGLHGPEHRGATGDIARPNKSDSGERQDLGDPRLGRIRWRIRQVSDEEIGGNLATTSSEMSSRGDGAVRERGPHHRGRCARPCRRFLRGGTNTAPRGDALGVVGSPGRRVE
jgi:hypothetical protein